ncbi:LysR family transcriptional regulator [Vibrio sp. B1FLJ16]|uniref:LysR family transcriptional regulator n=1 Tax=Vibrio sp. B1FLJ16 TaxID=2751178 RepID=UPI0015F4ADEF|nr:LysR family transcriptional regulator [Vibrio sp. B1FLJ16]CAD7819948.1 COG0583 Transcriptional regulator [Vibrio sp. B1FLJ16]CAE6941207.1 COG0583 Transcriptional regulator [Vibrio sp. B1FLJ16]
MNKELDLNLLKILVLLEKHRQLKPVAKALGKSEASISKYLARLRAQLNDELFIRHPHHLEPTQFLVRQLPKIADALEQLDRCLVSSEFKPENYEKDITISLPQVAQYSFGHLLAMELMETFPKAHITITTNNEHTVEDILFGKVDVQLHYFNDELPKSIYQRFVGYAPTIVVVTEESGITTLEQAAALPIAMFGLIGWKEREQLAKRALEEQGLSVNRIVTLDNVNALLKFVKETGFAGILHNFQAPIEGFRFIPIPESHFANGWPKVVAQMKQIHRHDAMHQILTDAIAKYMVSKT